jgi:hypothetical protein
MTTLFDDIKITKLESNGSALRGDTILKNVLNIQALKCHHDRWYGYKFGAKIGNISFIFNELVPFSVNDKDDFLTIKSSFTMSLIFMYLY